MVSNLDYQPLPSSLFIAVFLRTLVDDLRLIDRLSTWGVEEEAATDIGSVRVMMWAPSPVVGSVDLGGTGTGKLATEGDGSIVM